MKQRNAWMLWGVLVAAMLACVPVAWAQGPAGVRKQVEASMRVTGAIHIATDGSVERVQLDTPDKLPKGIADFVESNMAAWRFEPVLVDGVPRRALTKVSALLVGKTIGGGQMSVSIRGADFSDDRVVPATQQIAGRKLRPPGFPMSAAEEGVQGTVYLLVKVERDGTVGDVSTEQVNLRFVASEPQMKRHRDRFARVAMAAARDWTFTPPTEGEQAAQPHWIVRVPVDFTFTGPLPYGKWQVYVPGPRTRPGWAPQEDAPGFSPDALAEGGIHLAGGNRGPKLLTSLDGA
jgi:hypothetical protein